MLKKDECAQQVIDFLKVFKYYEDEFFGTAYYDIMQRKNAVSRKPKNITKDDDVNMVYEECYAIINAIDAFEFVGEAEFVNVRTAIATVLTIFNARRGGEPVRLQGSQWIEALNGDWLDEDDTDEEDMLVTFQTGKGKDHLVPVFFPSETIKGMNFLTDNAIRKQAGVSIKNTYVFASTRGSDSYVSGWHCMNDVLCACQ